MSKKQEAIELKLAKARLLLAEVDVLMDHEFYTTAINRLYYSCFHATRALLLVKDIIPKTHSGLIAMLYQHFVQSGNFDTDQAAFLNKLMQERIEDDYSDFMLLNKEDVEEFVEPARNYITYIEQLIKQLTQ